MSKPVERTCTELRLEGATALDAESKPLREYRCSDAYVLLGDPGSGKTTAFRAESQEIGSDSVFITARDFLMHESALDEWLDRTLFIDGLDEVRAGANDLRVPLDRIRSRIIELGKPKFRISCREADWLGRNDLRNLEYVANDSAVAALRLNPLSMSDVHEILARQFGVSDPEAFTEFALDQGVGGLLTNPQCLGLLVRSVKHGADWPNSRLELFELACNQLAQEQNDEHRNASQQRPSVRSLIDCAGHLCAIQLMADRMGYSLDPESETDDYPWMETKDLGYSAAMSEVLSSKLFVGVSGRRFTPVHRQVAEFLGATCLARLIEGGLPARRVLSLMVGDDGTVVTALRGLSAWLATFSKRVRSQLVADDAVGMGLYGDTYAFTLVDKSELLAALVSQPKRLGMAYANAKAFAPLATAGTEPQIRQILDCADRDPDQEIRVGFVLLMLSHGSPVGTLKQKIVEIARDGSWSPRIRQIALDAFIRSQPHSPGLAKALEELLAEIKENGISTSNRSLCGTLLDTLYPESVPPSEVWDYLTERAGSGDYDRYLQFWNRGLLAKSSESAVLDLLDSMSSRGSALDPALEHFHLRSVLFALLERGLTSHGDRVSPARIYNWLGASPAVLDRVAGNPSKAVPKIRAWLERHPEIQKNVVAMGLKECRDDSRVGYCDFRTRKRLFGAKLPADFGLWCLEQAVELARKRPKVARHLFVEAFRAIGNVEGGEGLTLDVLRESAANDKQLVELLAHLTSPPPPSREDTKWQQQQLKFFETQERQQQEWIDWVQSNESALVGNRAQPAMLHQLALVYFGEFPYVEGDRRGKDALAHVLRKGDTINAAMHGLLHTIHRADLPSVREIIRLARSQREHYLSLPLMAALEEGESSSPGFVLNVDDPRLRACVACYHCWSPDLSGASGSRPDWYQRLLECRPRIVSEVAVECATAALRSQRLVSPRFWDIAENEADSSVARGAIAETLNLFPARCNHRQLETLDGLLWTGLRLGAGRELLDLAGHKLSMASMNVGQRVRWLGLGLVLAPTDYSKTIAALLEGKEKLIHHLAEFYVAGFDPFENRDNSWRFRFEDLDSSTLEIIIRFLGKHFAPFEQRGFGYVSDEFRVALFLNGLIRHLGAKPDSIASRALDSLVGDASLVRWREYLSQTRDAQRALRRDAEYHHPTLAQVRETLSAGRPANPGDLAALTFDLLRDIAIRIRTTNTNDFRQYWNEGKRGRESEPKVESACRDMLLSDLRLQLPDSVDAQPEHQHVKQTRADIEISTRGFHLPIEVKKNSAPALWSAVQDQLIAKYTTDPTTNGYGIYLVFWFGTDWQQRHPDGTLPRSPQELEQQLEGSLSEEAARKIAICVVDVSRGD